MPSGEGPLQPRPDWRQVDAWVVLLALFLGGMAASVAGAGGLSVVAAGALGVATAATVYSINAGMNAIADRRALNPANTNAISASLPGDVEKLLARAQAAAEALAAQWPAAQKSSPVPGLDDRATGIAERLGTRARALTVVDAQLVDTNQDHLRVEIERVEREIANTDDDVLRAELDVSLSALRSRLAAASDLAAFRDRLAATVESTVLRLEAAVTHAGLLASRRAVAETIDHRDDEVVALLDQLDAARTGLDEIEAVTERVLGPQPGSGQLGQDAGQ